MRVFIVPNIQLGGIEPSHVSRRRSSCNCGNCRHCKRRNSDILYYRKIKNTEAHRAASRIASRNYYLRKKLSNEVTDEELERRLCEKFKREGWD